VNDIQASCSWEHEPDALSPNGTVFNRSCAQQLRTSAAFTFPRPQRSLPFSSALLAALPPCAAAHKAPAQRWQYGYVFHAALHGGVHTGSVRRCQASQAARHASMRWCIVVYSHSLKGERCSPHASGRP